MTREMNEDGRRTLLIFLLFQSQNKFVVTVGTYIDTDLY